MTSAHREGKQDEDGDISVIELHTAEDRRRIKRGKEKNKGRLREACASRTGSLRTSWCSWRSVRDCGRRRFAWGICVHSSRLLHQKDARSQPFFCMPFAHRRNFLLCMMT
jgi:hypothetical protein